MIAKIRIHLIVIVAALVVVWFAYLWSDGHEDREYTIVYTVYYSKDHVKTFQETNTKGFYVGSDRGTNFIKHGSITGQTVIKTSAPIEIVKNTYIVLK